MKRTCKSIPQLIATLGLLAAFLTSAAAPWQQAEDPTPPTEPVKLIFIHHSSGENWLADDNGGLGIALGQNNYFVSGTNYGWGPDAIGDRTDIPNWLEWFRSEGAERYMQAVYTESGQNSEFTRTLADPGGENQVILFKSCFPNSNLEGKPDDPPKDYEEMSVGGAKYVYNQILPYFTAHPEKLFIVITAPPVQDRTYAKNARAFNEWLVNDWLRENNYIGSNVAVFDFYNVLTGPDNHHRFVNGQIEHVFKSGRDNAYYPSEDDHPSAKGNRKATEEFVPLLNVFYHRWKASAPAQPAVTAPPAATALPTTASPAPAPVLGSGLVDNFEGGAPAGTSGWESFRDEATRTAIQCAPAGDAVHNGAGALAIEFNVTANSWATCALMYDSAQDWSAGEGLSFYIRASQAAQIVDVDVYTGSPDDRATYLYKFETTPESATGWIPVQLRWEDFHRADWEANAGEPLKNSQQITGIAFGFMTLPDAPSLGKIWVDDIQLLGGEKPVESPGQPQPGEPTAAPSPVEAGEKDGGGLPCAGGAALPMGLLALAWVLRIRAR